MCWVACKDERHLLSIVCTNSDGRGEKEYTHLDKTEQAPETAARVSARRSSALACRVRLSANLCVFGTIFLSYIRQHDLQRRLSASLCGDRLPAQLGAEVASHGRTCLAVVDDGSRADRCLFELRKVRARQVVGNTTSRRPAGLGFKRVRSNSILTMGLQRSFSLRYT